MKKTKQKKNVQLKSNHVAFLDFSLPTSEIKGANQVALEVFSF